MPLRLDSNHRSPKPLWAQAPRYLCNALHVPEWSSISEVPYFHDGNSYLHDIQVEGERGRKQGWGHAGMGSEGACLCAREAQPWHHPAVRFPPLHVQSTRRIPWLRPPRPPPSRPPPSPHAGHVDLGDAPRVDQPRGTYARRLQGLAAPWLCPELACADILVIDFRGECGGGDAGYNALIAHVCVFQAVLTALLGPWLCGASDACKRSLVCTLFWLKTHMHHARPHKPCLAAAVFAGVSPPART
jgi:hypothetical protein